MTANNISEIPVNTRLEALKAKHSALSKKVEDAQKDLSTTDFYLSQLKKEKLLIKEKLEGEVVRSA